MRLMRRLLITIAMTAAILGTTARADQEVTIILACTGPSDVVGSVQVGLLEHSTAPAEGELAEKEPIATKGYILYCWGKDATPPCRIGLEDDPTCKGRTANLTIVLKEGVSIREWTTFSSVGTGATKPTACASAGTSLPTHVSCASGKYSVQVTIH